MVSIILAFVIGWFCGITMMALLVAASRRDERRGEWQ